MTVTVTVVHHLFGHSDVVEVVRMRGRLLVPTTAAPALTRRAGRGEAVHDSSPAFAKGLEEGRVVEGKGGQGEGGVVGRVGFEVVALRGDGRGSAGARE